MEHCLCIFLLVVGTRPPAYTPQDGDHRIPFFGQAAFHNDVYTHLKPLWAADADVRTHGAM